MLQRAAPGGSEQNRTKIFDVDAGKTDIFFFSLFLQEPGKVRTPSVVLGTG